MKLLLLATSFALMGSISSLGFDASAQVSPQSTVFNPNSTMAVPGDSGETMLRIRSRCTVRGQGQCSVR